MRGSSSLTAAPSGSPGEVEADAVALVERAEPERVGRDRADLRGQEQRRQDGPEPPQRVQCVDGMLARDRVLPTWSSSPPLGVNPTRKWGSRSPDGPGTPNCSVQLAVSAPGIG